MVAAGYPTTLLNRHSVFIRRYTGCPECVADQSTGAGGDDDDGSDEADVGLTNLFFQ
jgi:hypothetical protein